MDTPESYRSIITGPTWEYARTLRNYVVEYTDKDGNVIACGDDMNRNEIKAINSCSNSKEDISNSRNSNKAICAIYFTSSNFYSPNTEEAFKKSLENDYYEWRNHKIKRASKHIFVRDVAKQFYVEGISNQIPDITSLITWLKAETVGYNVITIGSSSGAYMATLAGCLLDAQCVYCFSTFYNLNKVNVDVWNLIGKHSKDEKYNQYYELANYINNAKNTDIFYLYPALSTDEIMNDSIQCLEVCNMDNVYSFPIRSEGHGVVMATECVIAYINKTPNELRKIHSKLFQKNKIIEKNLINIPKTTIAIKLIGVAKVFEIKIKDYFNSAKKKISRKK